MTKKYDISFGIYDIEAENWITEDAEASIEYGGDKTDFDPLVNAMAKIIEDHKEEKAELELEENELENEEEIKETES